MRFLALPVLAALLAPQCDSKAIERQVCGEGKLVNREGVIKCEYPSPAPPTTTTTTSTSTTTTSTSTTTTSTTLPPLPPTPAPGCALPAMPECGRSQSTPGVYGCCFTDHHRPLPASPFDQAVDDAQDAAALALAGHFSRDGTIDEDVYVLEVVRQLRAKGLCATRGGPGDEVGIKASNHESFQIDVHLGNGRPRRSGYTAYCSPSPYT